LFVTLKLLLDFDGSGGVCEKIIDSTKLFNSDFVANDFDEPLALVLFAF
jgi:hypothetical protein